MGISFSSGTATDGDALSALIVSTPDTSGILTALGLNSFFVGSRPSDMRVNPMLIENPDRFAASKTGQFGDSTNLRSLVALRDSRFTVSSTQTFGEFVSELTARVGSQLKELQLVRDNLDLAGQRLRTDRESFSGVDPNEELVRMLQFQRSFQAAARHLAALDETLVDLLRILG